MQCSSDLSDSLYPIPLLTLLFTLFPSCGTWNPATSNKSVDSPISLPPFIEELVLCAERTLQQLGEALQTAQDIRKNRRIRKHICDLFHVAVQHGFLSKVGGEGGDEAVQSLVQFLSAAATATENNTDGGAVRLRRCVLGIAYMYW
jgi:hypothetical protein